MGLFTKKEGFDKDIVSEFGLKAFAISNVEKDMVCTYTRPIMSTNIGCYFIYDNNDELVYIGKSTSDLLTRACVSSVQRLLGDFKKIEYFCKHNDTSNNKDVGTATSSNNSDYSNNSDV